MQSLSVENLPAGITVAELDFLFRQFGWVARIDLRPGRDAAVGVVDLAWGGGLAARDLDGVEYRGRVLAVRCARGPAAWGQERTAPRSAGGDF